MQKINERRSPRHALQLQIQVSGADYQGRDFVEDSTTLVVSQHGAKIRLARKLIPDEEIRILHQGNKREGLFRVVGQAGEPMGEFSFWGVECLEPTSNIWETGIGKHAPTLGLTLARLTTTELVAKPVPQLDERVRSKNKSFAQAMLHCPKCGMRELVDLDDKLIQAIRRSKGIVRACPACGVTSLWKRAREKSS